MDCNEDGKADQSAKDDILQKDDNVEKGPRTIQLQKCKNGYGFTLRYFVVYPPDTTVKDGCSAEDEKNDPSEEKLPKRVGSESQSLDAMDTIFIKSVREGSEADIAGLAQGDRIVSVNGSPVTGKSYGEVVKLIQESESNLQLLVVPKEDDILQLYFSGSAYHQSPSSALEKNSNVSSAKDGSTSLASSSVANLMYHAPTFSQARTGSLNLQNDVELRSNVADKFSSYRNISSGNSRSLPSNYYSQSENVNPSLSSSSLSSYGKINYRPCPPPYGYHTPNYPPISTPLNSNQSSSGPSSLDSALSNKESVIGTSENRSLSDDQLPADIAYQHQSLVNRRKEEFLCNVSGFQNPQLSQSWFFDPNKKKPLSHPEPSKKSLLNSDLQVEQKLCTKSAPSSHIYSDSISSTSSFSPWTSESSMMQSWPSAGHHEPYHQAIQNPSLELANIKTSISNSQQSLCCHDDNANLNIGSKSHLNSLSSFEKLNCTPAVTSSSASQGDDQGLKYGRSFVTTLSKIQENLSNNPLNSHSLDKGDEQGYERSPLKKANSFDYDAMKTSQNTDPSQDASSEPPDNDKVSQLRLVSQRAKQFETGSQMWEVEANNKRNLYKNELARISSKCKTPRVVERTAKYENMSAASSQETISNIPETENLSHRNRTSAEVETKFCHHLAKMGIMTPSVVEATSSSSPQTSKSDKNSQVVSETPKGGHASRNGQAIDREHYRNEHLKKMRAMRQNSYLNAVCRDPKYLNGNTKFGMVCNTSEAQNSPTHVNNSRHQQVRIREATEPSLHHQSSIKRSASISECTFNRHHEMAVRLGSNRSSTTGHDLMKDTELFGSEFESLLDDGAISNLIAAFDSMLSGVSGSGSPTSCVNPSEQASSPVRGSSSTGVVLRKKQFYESASEDGAGGVRRVSYLKATSSDNVDDQAINKRAGHIETSNSNSCEETKQSTPRSHIHSIQKLKSFFGERTPQIVEASEKAQHHQLPSPNKESLPNFPQDIAKEGLLNCKATLVDGKRASDRSWKPVWAALRGHALYFYKDKKDANHFAPSEEHAPINVKACIVDIAYDYTKKKNVFRLTTFGASEFLFQADDNSDMLFWIQAIQENSNPDDDQKGVANQNLILRKSSAASSEHHHQLSVKDQVARLSPQAAQKTKSSRKGQQSEDSSPKSKTWRGKMVKSLRKFQGASTTATLPQTEGTTFGIVLEECPVTVNNEYVPILVELCTKIVEAKGLEVVGIYRIPGNNASVAALQDAANKGFENLNLQDPRWNDVNVISSLLKAFFRQLPEPLFTGELYPLFIEANKLEDNNQRMVTLKKLVHELPDFHYETLQHLMFHLKQVVKFSDINKMEARNLAIVFGPNLVRTADNNMVTMVTDMSHQCKIVETVISNVDWFFSVDNNEFNHPPTSSLESVEQTSSNTDILLGNIQRVEGLSGSHHGEVNNKDIMSNIISAANRRVKVKAKKDFDERDIDREIEMRHQKLRRGSAPSESLSAKSGGKVYLTDWIKSDGVDSANSTLSLSSRTLSSQTLSEDAMSYQSTDTKPSNESLDRDKDIRTGSINSNLSKKISPSEHSTKNNSSRELEGVKDRYAPSDNPKLISNDKNPPYMTLSPSTQERIKRFEAETKAFLQRDLHARRSRHDSERHRHELERQRIELEWQRAKRDLEQEDFLDELADNPSDISRRISDFAYKISDLNCKPDAPVQPTTKTTDTSDYSSLGASPMNAKYSSSSSTISVIHPCSSAYNIKSKPKFTERQSTPSAPSAPTVTRIPSSRGRKKAGMESSLRRGKSAENFVDLEPNASAAVDRRKPNLSFKHGGSLDSLRENYASKDDLLNYSMSDDGDLLTSLTSTLDSKLQVISSLGNRKIMPLPPSSNSSKSTAALIDSRLNYRDPSLYRSRRPMPNGTTAVSSPEWKPSSSPIHRSVYRDPNSLHQNRPNNRKGIVGNEHFLLHFNNDDFSALAQQGSSKKKTKPVAKPNGEEEMPFRQEYTTVKATISQRKNSVIVSPTSTAIINSTCKEKKTGIPVFPLKKSISRDDLNNNKCFKKQKCNPIRVPLKRRHTVAGIQDFDKFKCLLSNENSRFSKEPRLSAWEQLRPVENLPPEQRSLKSWMMRERLRTSSPDLFHLKKSSSGDCFSVFQVDLSRRRNVPQQAPALESLV